MAVEGAAVASRSQLLEQLLLAAAAEEELLTLALLLVLQLLLPLDLLVVVFVVVVVEESATVTEFGLLSESQGAEPCASAAVLSDEGAEFAGLPEAA